jgi:hypothetical protein
LHFWLFNKTASVTQLTLCSAKNDKLGIMSNKQEMICEDTVLGYLNAFSLHSSDDTEEYNEKTSVLLDNEKCSVSPLRMHGQFIQYKAIKCKRLQRKNPQTV